LNENLTKAIFNHISGATGLPEVYYPNVSKDTPADEHIIVSIVPNETLSVGVSELNQARGIINILIKTKESIGTVRANQIADDILTLFGRNTTLTSGGTKVRIDREGWTSPPLGNIDGWYILPVTIPYNSIY